MQVFDLKTGFTCNNFCVHCVIQDKKKICKDDLTTKEIENIILTKAPKNSMINFTGGEVTIREDFEHLVNFAHDNGHLIVVQTNGTGLANEELVIRLKDKLHYVLIAIHAFDREIHNRIVGDIANCAVDAHGVPHIKETNERRHKEIMGTAEPSMYDKTMSGFKNLIKHNVPCGTQTVISSLNKDYLFDTYSKIQEIKPGILMSMTYPHGMGNARENHEIVCIKYSELKDQIRKSIQKFGKYILTEAIPKCYLHPYAYDILKNQDDECFTRGHLMGIDPSNKNINSKLFDEEGVTQDYGLNNLLSKRKAPKCKECIYFDECPGVWQEYIEWHKDKLDLFPIYPIKAGAIPLRSKDEVCQNSCRFCSGGKAKEQDWDMKEFYERADYFIKNKYSIVEITGEPCQHPNLIEAIKYLHDNRIYDIQISTHGRTFKDKELVNKLFEAGVRRVRIPLYGSTQEIHELTASPKTKGDNSFKEACDAIRNCAEVGIRVCGQTLINRNNQYDISNIYKTYKHLSGDMLIEMSVTATGVSDVSYEWTDGWYLPIKDYGPAVTDFLDATADDETTRCQTLGIPFCVYGKYDNRMHNYVNKPDLGIGKVNVKMAGDKERTIPHYQLKEKFSECEHCALKDECDGMHINDMKLFGTYGLKAIKEI